MMYLQMYNECELVIAYYDEKDIVLGDNVRLVKLVIRLQFYNMYVLCSRHNTWPVIRLIIREISR